MRFSLQEMVRKAVDEAEYRTKLAQTSPGATEGEGEKEKGKAEDKRSPETPPTNKATTPERNEQSMDVDKDNDVDIQDLQLVAGRWGEIAPFHP
jgi:hypothetical protein